MNKYHIERLPNSLLYVYERGPNWAGCVATVWNAKVNAYDLHFVSWPADIDNAVVSAIYDWLEAN